MLYKEGDIYQRRREFVFILISGIFLGSLALLNVLGLSKLINLSFYIGSWEVPFRVFIGVLPYPITFLCTDFISEFYGKRRASYVVWVGLILNAWVLFIMWLGGVLPDRPEIIAQTGLPEVGHPNYPFYYIRSLTFSATLASMAAYLIAQFVDVHVFHYLKRIAPNKLWVRNNGSTMVSQMVDSVSVILITYFSTTAIEIPEGSSTFGFLLSLIISGYLFKFISAAIDTVPFYFGVHWLKKYLNVESTHEPI